MEAPQERRPPVTASLRPALDNCFNNDCADAFVELPSDTPSLHATAAFLHYLNDRSLF